VDTGLSLSKDLIDEIYRRATLQNMDLCTNELRDMAWKCTKVESISNAYWLGGWLLSCWWLFSIGHTRKNISGETADAVWLEKIPQEMLELLIGILVSDIIFGV
jgi:hypothetical protein